MLVCSLREGYESVALWHCAATDILDEYESTSIMQPQLAFLRVAWWVRWLMFRSVSESFLGSDDCYYPTRILDVQFSSYVRGISVNAFVLLLTMQTAYGMFISGTYRTLK